jgi:hypothetical protein
MDSRRSQDCFRSIQESLHKLGEDEQAVYSSSNLKSKTSNEQIAQSVPKTNIYF